MCEFWFFSSFLFSRNIRTTVEQPPSTPAAPCSAWPPSTVIGALSLLDPATGCFHFLMVTRDGRYIPRHPRITVDITLLG